VLKNLYWVQVVWNQVIWHKVQHCVPRQPNDKRGNSFYFISQTGAFIPSFLFLGLEFCGFWCKMQVVLVGGAEITTVDNLQYSYRPLPEGAIHVEVRAPSNAHVALTSGNHETEPMYEILLGGWENTASVIRYNRQKPDKVHNFCYSVFCWIQARQKFTAILQNSPIKQK
jgi:hypothetical protein